MDKSKSLDARRISKAYDLSVDDARDYVADIRSRMSEDYKTHTVEWVAGKYNVSKSAVKYAAKQFGVKKDIKQTQFKRAQDYTISPLEQTAEEGRAVTLNVNYAPEYAKTGSSLIKTAMGIAVAAAVIGISYFGINSNLNKNYSNNSKQNSSVVQSAKPTNYSFIPSVAAAEVPKAAEKAYVIPAEVPKVAKVAKPVRTIINDSKEVKNEVKIIEEVAEAKSISPDMSAESAVIDSTAKIITPLKKDSGLAITAGAGYLFGKNNAASVGASLYYGKTIITPSLLIGDSDAGASLDVSRKLGNSYELRGSAAMLGDRGAVAFGLEKLFNLTNDKKTKFGLELGLDDTFKVKDDGFAGYASATLMREVGKKWNLGLNVLGDTQGHFGGFLVGGYNINGNIGAYNPGVAGELVSVSDKKADETTTETTSTQTTENNNHSNNNTPVTPTTSDQTTWGTGSPVGK